MRPEEPARCSLTRLLAGGAAAAADGGKAGPAAAAAICPLIGEISGDGIGDTAAEPEPAAAAPAMPEGIGLPIEP